MVRCSRCCCSGGRGSCGRVVLQAGHVGCVGGSGVGSRCGCCCHVVYMLLVVELLVVVQVVRVHGRWVGRSVVRAGDVAVCHRLVHMVV